MIKAEYFYHEQTQHATKSLGFSMRFVPATGADEVNQFGERMVWVNSTHCNKKDKHFNKKIARKVLRDEKPLQLVRCKDVPLMLTNARRNAHGEEEFQYVNRHDYRILCKFL